MKKTVLFFFGLMVFACSEKVVEAPENLIPKEKMTSILYDLAMLNATKSAFSNVFDDSGIDIMEYLYEKYDIDSTQLAESDLYYASIPLEYQSIYEDVADKVEARRAGMEAASKKENDSVRKAQIKVTDSLRALKKEKDTITP